MARSSSPARPTRQPGSGRLPTASSWRPSQGTPSAVQAVTFSVDGNRIATGSADKPSAPGMSPAAGSCSGSPTITPPFWGWRSCPTSIDRLGRSAIHRSGSGSQPPCGSSPAIRGRSTPSRSIPTERPVPGPRRQDGPGLRSEYRQRPSHTGGPHGDSPCAGALRGRHQGCHGRRRQDRSVLERGGWQPDPLDARLSLASACAGCIDRQQARGSGPGGWIDSHPGPERDRACEGGATGSLGGASGRSDRALAFAHRSSFACWQPMRTRPYGSGACAARRRQGPCRPHGPGLFRGLVSRRQAARQRRGRQDGPAMGRGQGRHRSANTMRTRTSSMPWRSPQGRPACHRRRRQADQVLESRRRQGAAQERGARRTGLLSFVQPRRQRNSPRARWTRRSGSGTWPTARS